MVEERRVTGTIAQLFDHRPEPVVWLYALVEDALPEKIVDFEVVYCNPAAATMMGTGTAAITGQRLLAITMLDAATAQLVFRQCLDVWNSGRATDYTYYNPALEKTLKVQRSRFEGGVLSIATFRADLQEPLPLQAHQRVYQKIIDTSRDGVLLLEPVSDEAGTIVDFRMVYCNNYAIEAGQLAEDYAGKTILQLLPHIKKNGQFDLHKRVAENGKPLRFETTFKTPGSQDYGWFIVTLTKVENMVVSRFTDITERKQAEVTITEQAAKQKQIINASLNAIFTCEAIRDHTGTITDLRYTQINDMFRQIIGKGEEEVIGKTMLSLFPTSKPTGAFATHCRVIESGVAERFQLYYNGEGLDVWFDASSVRLDTDSVMVTFADITEQKNIFLQLERQKILLDNLLQYSPSGISIIEAIRKSNGEVVDFRNVLLNDRAAEFSGLSREILLARSNVEIDPAFTGSATCRMLCHTLQTGEACYTDYYIESTGKWIERAVSRMDANRLICIFTDVTAARESQLQMKSLVEELRRSNQSLEEFAYAASHDLQEPLRKIHFFSERLKKGMLSGSQIDNVTILERMEIATTRMQKLIEDLLTYSQASRKPSELKGVDLTSIVETVVQDFEPVILETGALVTVDKLPVINGDERQLRQLFQNLLGNALKYRRQNVAPVITVQCQSIQDNDPAISGFANGAKKAYHLIAVADNGIGFEQEYAEKIFHVFTRLHGNSEYAGTGVGLAIVQKVVQNHNGYITAEGLPGEGAVFQLRLPV